MAWGKRMTLDDVKRVQARQPAAVNVAPPAVKPRRASKYHNVKVETEEGTVDSKREAKRLRDLRLRQRAGDVTAIARQVRFTLMADGVKFETYVADFVYLERFTDVWRWTVEDAKGAHTPAYRRKKRLMLELFGIRILET